MSIGFFFFFLFSFFFLLPDKHAQPSISFFFLFPIEIRPPITLTLCTDDVHNIIVVLLVIVVCVRARRTVPGRFVRSDVARDLETGETFYFFFFFSSFQSIPPARSKFVIEISNLVSEFRVLYTFVHTLTRAQIRALKHT